jgi:hypothetical protein
MFLKTVSPIKIEIKVEQIGKDKFGNDKFKLFYSETAPDDCPQDALDNTMEIMKDAGFDDIKLEGRTFSYTKEGKRNIFNGVATELLNVSDLGNMPLSELIIFASLALNKSRDVLNKLVKCPTGDECVGAVCLKAETCETLQKAMQEITKEREKENKKSED